MRADLVAVGGRVHSTLPDAAVHTGLAVRGGRILAVGRDDDVLGTAASETLVVELSGRTVVPGLIDSHIHAVRAGLTWAREVRWDGIGTLHEALETIAAAARQRPEGMWICVLGGWHPGQFREGRAPTKDDLDRVAPHHPVFVQQLNDGAVLNSLGLGRCRIGPGTPDPPGGRLEQDGDGVPTGRVQGTGALTRCQAAMKDPTHEEQVESTRAFLLQLARWGITGVVDAGGFGMTPERYEPLFDLWKGGALPLRMRLYVGPATPGGEYEQVQAWLDRIDAEPGDAMLKPVGIGEIGIYACHDMEGLSDHNPDEQDLRRLFEVSRLVASAGLPMQLHAITQSSISAILDVWEQVDAAVGIAGRRFCLAHAERISAQDLRRVRGLGVGILLQNRLSLRTRDSAQVWGADAARQGAPLHAIAGLGIPFGAGTDATRVSSPNPWTAIEWFTTGSPVDGGPARHPSQHLTRTEALRAYTEGSAWFSGEEDERGALAPGRLADFAVLSEDCFTSRSVTGLESVLTVVHGRPVHAASEFTGIAE
ncbi:MAG: amidohydrolase family protein [Nitriliruptorales bacterium]|nr:amidohydrolase family protein [Nitriliruptorales bacterium]